MRSFLWNRTFALNTRVNFEIKNSGDISLDVKKNIVTTLANNFEYLTADRSLSRAAMRERVPRTFRIGFTIRPQYRACKRIPPRSKERIPAQGAHKFRPTGYIRLLKDKPRERILAIQSPLVNGPCQPITKVLTTNIL